MVVALLFCITASTRLSGIIVQLIYTYIGKYPISLTGKLSTPELNEPCKGQNSIH